MQWNLFFLLVFQLSAISVNAGAVLELHAPEAVFYKSGLVVTCELKNAESKQYTWIFSANVPNGFRKTEQGGLRATFNETFDIREDQAGNFTLDVTVKYTRFFITETEAAAKINFSLSTTIPIKMNVEQDRVMLSPQNGTLSVSSMSVANATVQIIDPSNYFANQDTKFVYYWTLNRNEGIYNYSFQQKYPSDPDKVSDTLQVTVTAHHNGTVLADASLSTAIYAKTPVLDLNSTGVLYLRRGRLAQLSFSCNATPPIYYCYKSYANPTNTTNPNCTDTQFIRSESCDFGVLHFFGSVGDHEIKVAVRNEVNDFMHQPPLTKNYKFHVYDVEKEGLLHLFIVPISCIIIGTIVAVSGVAFYKHTKGDIRVEVADFDFGGASTREEIDAMLVERTFWTHLRDELAESSPMFRWMERKRPFPNAAANNGNANEQSCDSS